MSAPISSSVWPSPAVRTMNPPVIPWRCALEDLLQPLPLFIACDLSRYAHMLNRRHVHDVPAGQSDMRSDAGALLAERLFRDLNNDLLPFFE